MEALLVVAHPLPESLCHTLARTALETLAQQGHRIVQRDLYACGLHPALTVEERRLYYGEPVYDRAAAAELEAAELIVVVFPTWWFGFPAILKGWFDRVWMPGVAYD